MIVYRRFFVYYLRQGGGYAIGSLCLSVILSFYYSVCRITHEFQLNTVGVAKGWSSRSDYIFGVYPNPDVHIG